MFNHKKIRTANAILIKKRGVVGKQGVTNLQMKKVNLYKLGNLANLYSAWNLSAVP